MASFQLNIDGIDPTGDRSYLPWNHPHPQEILIQSGLVKYLFLKSPFSLSLGVGRPPPQLTPLIVDTVTSLSPRVYRKADDTVMGKAVIPW